MFAFSKISITKLLANNTKWLEKQQTSINSAAAIIAMANAFSVIFGLVRTRTILSYFSETTVTSWSLAFQIPDLLFQFLVFGALSASFIPIFLSVKKDHDSETAFKMSGIVLNILLIAFTFFSIVVFIFAEPITLKRIGSEISSSNIAIIVNLTRIMLFAQVLFTISNVMTGILQSYKRFIIPSLAPIIYNLGIIIGVMTLSKSFGIYSAGIGVVIGALFHMLVQVPLAVKLGFKPTLSFNLKFPGVKKIFLLSPARLITIGISQLQTFALAYFATSIGELSYLYIYYATTLSLFPIRMFGVPLSQAALPFLSQYAKSDEYTKFRDVILQSLHQISFLAMPTSVLLLILRIPIVRLAYGTSNFSWTSTVSTGKVLAILALSITAQAMVQLIIRGFHALKDTHTPLVISILFIFLYLAGSYFIVTSTTMGVVGLAIVSALSFFMELLLFILLLNRKVPQFISKKMWIPQFKMLLSSFFMAVFLYLPFRIFDELIFDTTKTIELIGLTITTATIGGLVYIYFAALFEIKELELITRTLKSFSEKWKSSVSKTQEFMVETSVDNESV